MKTEKNTPTRPDTIDIPMAGSAPLDPDEDPPVGEAPEPDCEPEPEAPVAVADAGEPVIPTLARSVYNDADVYVTQLLDAAGVGV